MRAIFSRREFYLGAVLGLMLAAPSVIWQASHGWPFAELVHAAGHKNAVITPLAFAIEQILVMNPFAMPIWVAGVLAPFLRSDMRSARAFPIAFAVTAAIVPVREA